MAYHDNGKIVGEIELGNAFQKRRYPRGAIAIKNIEKFFENRLITMYKDAPAKWKEDYAREVFGRINRYKKIVNSKK